ncbi:AMP-dependent synthetase/ligase [Acididesulfobacillus acetoxydans]|uniref:AMP-dependent synthetase/ligase n=1 Tax=Acididesulfobacillus acetoxydans TaxID=1561005 RepID=A0A8S0X500_9FIRM|nr:AMP-binding protein [Acididesulfobacillus acetoxydans]CAA7601220.1 AMP-dependent synthetase/ligase [Acididesulfobacillus acetoxydans]CEJ08501.1 Long-chain-fatty-acid--CoA ligase [Acididesulfobacillus acetoxydans]
MNPKKGWPRSLSQVLEYRLGAKPLPEYLREHALRTPDKPVIQWYGRAISYSELDVLSDRFAAFLAGLGVKKGDRVALFLSNSPQYFIVHFGIQKLGAIVSPCSPAFKEWELEYQLNDLDTQVLVAADSLYGVVEKIKDKTALKHIILTSYGDFLPLAPLLNVPDELRAPKRQVPGTYDLMTVLADVAGSAAQMALSLEKLALDDLALMVYTSGTTGKPKGAMLTHRNALFKAAAAAQSNQVGDSDVLLSVVPLYHIAGMLMGLNVTVYAGATTVLLNRFDPVAVLQAIHRYHCTWWYSIAPMNVAVMQVPQAGDYDLSSLKNNIGTSFGITLTEELDRAWRNFTRGCPLHEAAYGLSETHTGDTFMPSEAVKWGTQGIPTYETEIKIIDPETGAEKGPGETGEILVSNPGVFQGYWRRPEATAVTLRDGWVHSGDMGQLDEDGYLVFCGRYKEMIKVSGYSVFPEEVEEMLIRHDAIAQVAVIGVPDPQRGEAVKAFVVLKPGKSVSEEGIIAWARERMSHYKAPRSVELRQSLPVTGAGKLLRRLLKDS